MGDEGYKQIATKKRRRMLFSRRVEEQSQWVVGMTDKCRGILRGRAPVSYTHLTLPTTAEV